MTKSRVTLILLILLIVLATIGFVQSAVINASNNVFGRSMISAAVSVVLLLAILVAHLRGWRWSAEAAVVITAAFTVIATTPNYLSNNVLLSPFIPTVIAAILLSPGWSMGVYAAILLGLAAIGAANTSETVSLQQALGPTFTLLNMVQSVVLALGISLGGVLARRAQHEAEASALRAEEERTRFEQRSQELAQANDLAQSQIDQQKQLLELVATLEVPVTSLADGVLFAPIVGHVDTRRAQSLTTRLLQATSERRARVVILDISGVSLIDTAVARALLEAVQALRLLGCEVTISGISANVAMTLTQLGIDLEGVATVRSPQEALAHMAAHPGEKTGLRAALTQRRAS
ncbi:MAG TPA: STAS domain-containing protein [Roseiflexaceae bacterium]|nr:STAS domain-containing protein [Roseiflexaceae bacterium]